MTEWTLMDAARHIPEDELHAYLDQALSRSQCVEIECHLAVCPACADARDGVAAVRDRITALLADAEPVRRPVVPAYDQLVAQFQGMEARSRRTWRRVTAAAGLAAALTGAVAAGWWSRALIQQGTRSEPTTSTPTTVATASIPEQPLQGERTLIALAPPQLDPAEPVVPVETEAERGVPPRPEPEVGIVRVATTPAPLTIQVSTFDPVDDGSAGTLEGLWQAVDWYEAWTLTNGNLPRIEGLPVVGVQVRRVPGESRPVVVVSQQHPSGRVVRTIEGPVELVATLVESQVGGRVNASAASFTPPDYLTVGGVARRGLRILTVTGALPADSLNALAQEITLRE